MAPLHRAFPFAKVDAVAMLIGNQLDLDMPWTLDQLLQINFTRTKAPLRFALRAFQRPCKLFSAFTARMPLPPPPAAAFSITGIPNSPQRLCFRRDRQSLARSQEHVASSGIRSLTGASLRAEHPHGIRGWPDKLDASCIAGIREGSIF